MPQVRGGTPEMYSLLWGRLGQKQRSGPGASCASRAGGEETGLGEEEREEGENGQVEEKGKMEKEGRKE